MTHTGYAFSLVRYESYSPVCHCDFFVVFLCLVILFDESSVFEALITLLTLSKKISIHLIGRDRCVTWFSDWPKQNSRGAREETYSSTPNNTKGKRIFIKIKILRKNRERKKFNTINIYSKEGFWF